MLLQTIILIVSASSTGMNDGMPRREEKMDATKAAEDSHGDSNESSDEALAVRRPLSLV